MSNFIFEGFEPANTVPVPDVLFDVLLPHLNEAQLKVMLYIIRRTLGFKKTSDAISLKQFRHGITKKKGEKLDEGCGLKNMTTIIKALNDLEEMGCIESKKDWTEEHDKATTVYSIHFKGTAQNVVPTAQNVVPTTANVGRGTAQNVGRVLRKTESQETVLQETVRQESVSPSPETTTQVSTHTPSEINVSSEFARSLPQGNTEKPIPPSPDKAHVNPSKKERWEDLLDYWDRKYGPGARPDRVVEKAKDMIERMKPTPEQVDKVCAELKARKKPITFETMYNNWHLLKEVEEREQAKTNAVPKSISGRRRVETDPAYAEYMAAMMTGGKSDDTNATTR